MIVHISVSVLAYLAVFTIAVVLGLYIWKRRARPGGYHFALLMALLAFWAIMCMIELVTSDPFLVSLTILAEYLAVTCAGPLWLLFALDYGYRGRWPVAGKTWLIWVLPAVIMVLAVTNQWHGLIWVRSPADLAVFGHGIGLWLNLIYTYLLMLGGFALLGWAIVGSREKTCIRAAVLIIGTMVPIASSLLYMLGLDVNLVGEITPFALGVTIITYAWSIFGLHLFELVPVARETLTRSTPDGVLILDSDGLILEANPAAMLMLDLTDASLGRPANAVLAKWPRMAELCSSSTEESDEILISATTGPMWLELRGSLVRDSHGKPCGRLVTLRNITKRRLAEEDLMRINASLQAEINERKQIETALLKSNEALQKEIVERRHAEERLQVSLGEKELLLKEIHHRVKNNLQIITSLLSLQMVNSPNVDASTILRESQNRIRSMALIHEKLYQSQDLAHVDFKGYLHSLLASLRNSYVISPGIRIVTDIEDLSLDIDTAIPCGLIINELISNSLKYAFPNRATGQIKVSLTGEGETYRLIVSDDGIGLPPGFDYRNTASLGLQLVVSLTGQLNGVIEHPEGPGTINVGTTKVGTTFVITFPKASS